MPGQEQGPVDPVGGDDERRIRGGRCFLHHLTAGSGANGRWSSSYLRDLQRAGSQGWAREETLSGAQPREGPDNPRLWDNPRKGSGSLHQRFRGPLCQMSAFKLQYERKKYRKQKPFSFNPPTCSGVGMKGRGPGPLLH